MKASKTTVASIILKWEKFGTTKTLPRAGRLAKLSNRGRRALVTKNPMVNLTDHLSSSVEIEKTSRRTTISAALHQSGHMKIALFGLNARKPGTIPTVKHGGGGGKMKRARYREILDENLLQGTQDLRLG